MLAKFQQFWNEAAEEICSDKAALRKLNSSVKAIEGAIHTSWKKKKTDLLLIEVDEIRTCCKHLYGERKGVQPFNMLQTVERNAQRLEKAQVVVVGAYEEASSKGVACSKDVSDKMKGAMTELKKLRMPSEKFYRGRA